MHDISKDIIRPKLVYEKNKQVIAFQENESTLGTVMLSENKKLFPELTVQSCSDVNIKLLEDDSCPYITGCVIMPDGNILICDRSNHKVKHLSKTHNTILDSIKLQGRTWDACMIDETTIIVCLPDNKQLQYVEVKPALKKGRTLTLDINCYGIDVVGEEIYVTSPDCYGVHVFGVQGNIKRKVDVGNSTSALPYYLKVKPKLNNIYFTDSTRNMFLCFKEDCQSVFRYSHKDLKEPRGFCVDDKGNAVLIGNCSNNLHVVSANGEHVGFISHPMNVPLINPHYLSYIEESGTLIVGFSNNSKLLVFKLA